jgi:large subunit ribosomal protein L18
MAIKSKKDFRRLRIKMRIRKVISGTPECPRLSVFRSNKEIYAQLIDDLNGRTLVSTSTLAGDVAEQKLNKTDKAKRVGRLIAEKAKEMGISQVVFDRNGYLYHGRVKFLAEAAREGGLKF